MRHNLSRGTAKAIASRSYAVKGEFMNNYGNEGELKVVLHEWTGTGVRDISTERALKSDTIFTLTDGNDGKKYIGCVRPEWDMIKDSSKISDVENKIEGIRCRLAYGPGDYLIFMVI